MGKCSFIFLFLLAILSCQKEYNPDSPSGGGFFGYYMGGKQYREDRFAAPMGSEEHHAYSAFSTLGETIGILVVVSPYTFWIQFPISAIQGSNHFSLNPDEQLITYEGAYETSDIVVTSSSFHISKYIDHEWTSFPGVLKLPLIAGSFEMSLELKDKDGNTESVGLTDGYFDLTIEDGSAYSKHKDYIRWVINRINDIQ